MGTSTAPWAHRVLSPCSYRFNTPSIISPLLILPGRACSALRLQPGYGYRLSRPRRMEPDTLVFLQTWADIVALACERWQQLKPRQNFLRIAEVRRGVGARDLSTSTGHVLFPFLLLLPRFGCESRRHLFTSRGVMPAVSRGETL